VIETLLGKLFPPQVGKVETWTPAGTSFDPFDLPESLDGVGQVREKIWQEVEKPQKVQSIGGRVI
jgi:hypothetical protein